MNASELAQPVLLDTRESKGDQREKILSGFKKLTGIGASLWQKVDFLCRKRELSLGGRSTSSKYKRSQGS